MNTGYQDLPCSLSTYELKIILGAPYLDPTSSFRDLVIPYTGIANPSDSNVSLSRYWYSLDNGSTWEVMTPTAETSTTGLSFTPSGIASQFKWHIKDDIGSSIYNISIKIAFKASGALGDSLEASRFVLLSRTVVDQSDQGDELVRFPVDYTGIAGRDLLRNAPRS